MSGRAPDRLGRLYTSHFSRDGKACEADDKPDRVILSCSGTAATFRLPRHADLFDQAKHMLWAAYSAGQENVRAGLRDMLGVKDCTCSED